MNTFNPNKSISSRYAITNIVSNKYHQTILSGNTSNYPLATLTSGGTYTAGYVWVPYIILDNTNMTREYMIELLRKERKEKLNNLGW